MKAADIDLLHQGYKRGWLPWERVRTGINATLPRCQHPGCDAPANGGGWLPGEQLCAEHAMERMKDGER